MLFSSKRNVSQNGIAWTETRRLGLPRRAILVHSLFQTPSQPSCIPPCACKSRPWNENVSCGKYLMKKSYFLLCLNNTWISWKKCGMMKRPAKSKRRTRVNVVLTSRTRTLSRCFRINTTPNATAYYLNENMILRKIIKWRS